MQTSVFYVSDYFALTQALSAIKALRAEGDLRPYTIAITEDVYLEEPLTIDIPSVTLESCGGQKRLIGGVKIKNWRQDTFNGIPCRSAMVENHRFTDLWVDGKRADATRYPKEGEIAALQTEKNLETKSKNLFASSKWIVADLANVKGIEDATIHYYHYWIDEHSPVESYDPATGKLVMKYASRFMINTDLTSAAGMQFYLTNIPSTFGAENEWYLDHQSGTVYYCGEVSEAFAPTLTNLITVTADHVRLRDLEILCSRGDYQSNRVLINGRWVPSATEAFGSDIQSVCWAPAAVTFCNAKNGAIEGCTLHHLGLHAIELQTSCTNIRIENNRIQDIGAGGIKIFGGAAEEDPALATAHCTIRSNEIACCGRRYAAGCGILANHTSYLEISENHIHHLDYTGVSVGWVWGYAPSSTFANRICRNHIHHIGMGRLSDMGGIYLLGRQPGTVVSENRIHHVTSANYGGWGIYTDEGSSYITVENNVVYCTKEPAFHQHYGSYNVVRNNIFASANGGVQITRYEDHPTVLLEQNIILTDHAPAYHLNEGIQSLQSSCNLFWDRSSPVQMVDQSIEKLEKSGKDAGSIVADPLFRNAEEYDFTLRPDSPALKLGFKPLKGFLVNGKGE